MKFLILAVCIACAAAAEVSEKDAPVLRNDYTQNSDGSFDSAYETANGISAQARGYQKPIDKDVEAQQVEGQYQFKTPDGQVIQTTYVANENGFQAQGAHLPTPPAPEPIPDYILRSLDYIRDHPYKESKE